MNKILEFPDDDERLEAHIRRTLRTVASTVDTDELGATEVFGGSAAKVSVIAAPVNGPAPRRTALLAVAAMAATVILGVSYLVARDTPGQTTTDTRQPGQPDPIDAVPTVEANETAPAVDADGSSAISPEVSFAHLVGQLPRVVINRPEFRITGGAETSYDWSPLVEAGTDTPFVVYGDSGLGFDGAYISMQVVDSISFADDVVVASAVVNGRPADLIDGGRFLSAIVWNDGDGEVILMGIRLSADEIIRIAESVRRGDAGGLSIVDPPAGLELQDAGSPPETRAVSAEFEWALGDLKGDLLIESGSRSAFASKVFDRVFEADGVRNGRIGDIDVAMISFPDETRMSAMWSAEGLIFELRGSFGSLDELEAILADVTVVDEERWQTIVPEEWVEDPPNEIQEILVDIPVPDGFDIAELNASARPGSRYQLGALVVGRVTCAWLDQWTTATRLRDANAAEEAVAALATSTDWAILDEMSATGAYGQTVAQYADAIATDGLVTGGRVLTVQESYGDALGCPWSREADHGSTAPATSD